jgi:hypothetical protein
MPYISTIKEGVKTVNKNWQLVFVQFASMVLSCISFFAIVGIPIAVAFIMFGLDFTEILRLEDFLSAFRGSAELLNKYFAMAIVLILSLLVYVAFIAVVWVFTIGGTIGIISKTISGNQVKFGIKAFFEEGKSLFMRVVFFSGMVSSIFIVLAFILGIMGGIASSIIETAKTYEAALALFLGVFFSLIFIAAGLLLIIVTLSIAIYGIAHIAFNKTKPFIALKETAQYLYEHPSAVLFYGILISGYIITGFFVILIGSPFTLIPIIGPILTLPYQLVTYAVQSYISLVMFASVFHYYYNTVCNSRICGQPLQSIPDSDISPATENPQASALEETAENRQD